MTEKQMEIKERLREQTEKLFSIIMELEDIEVEADNQWTDAEIGSEEEEFWSDMKSGLEDLVLDLNNIYTKLDEDEIMGSVVYELSEEELEATLKESGREKSNYD